MSILNKSGLLWVQIDDEDVEVLVDLMRVPAAMAKQMLQKVFTNLCCHHQTRQTILKLLMRLLYLSMVDPDLSSPDGRSKHFLASSRTPFSLSCIETSCDMLQSNENILPIHGDCKIFSLRSLHLSTCLDIHLADH